jgi:hypothetical protein
MSNTIKLKKSSVAAKVPLASDLDYGELAINYTDGNLFFKNSNNNIQTLTSTQFVSVTGNVTGNYFIGDGSLLTGIAQETGLYGDGGGMGLIDRPVTSQGDAGTVTSAAVITQDLGSVTSSAVPVQYVAKDLDIINTISVTGNIMVGNILTDGYYYANGAPFSAEAANSYGNTNVAAFLSNSFGSNTIVTTGNITTGNIFTDGYYYANGAPFSGGGGGNYGNANVVTLVASFGSNTISTTGNITAGNFIGDGSQISNITTNIANIANIAYSVNAANVSGTVANATYAESAGSSSTAGTAATVTDSAQPNITSVGTLSSVSVSGNITGGNLSISGGAVSVGNIEAAYFIGNGSQLTGISGGSADFTNIASNVLPSADVTYNLGSADRRWNDLWLSNATIHIGAVSISAASGNLELPASVQIGNVTLAESGGNLALPEGTEIGGAQAASLGKSIALAMVFGG